MEQGMLEAAMKAFGMMFHLHTMALLFGGCIMGLVLGILPGIGGLAGTALLLPFTFGLDPVAAMALLLGLGATTATGDPIPAILFGVPGGAGSAATVLDGLPMAKRGEASRALSAMGNPSSTVAAEPAPPGTPNRMAGIDRKCVV